MGRPRNAVRGTDLHVVLPPDIAGWLEIHLYSEAQQRVPVGAKAALITRLLREYKQLTTGGPFPIATGTPNVHP